MIHDDRKDMTIRPAEPADAGSVARLLVLAWPVDAFLDMDGDLTEEDLLDTVTCLAGRTGNLYGYDNVIVACMENPDGTSSVVGAICGYDGTLFLELRKAVAQEIGKRFPKAVEGLESWPCEASEDEFYLDSVGVLPECRGMGIASSLFAAMLLRAKEQGHQAAGLLVDEEKPQAERLYLRLGFAFDGFKDFFGHRMKHLVYSFGSAADASRSASEASLLR
ncbi:MAG: GNAT family N-acetyltransferase [Candidatus Cryptobacteroides sp.]